ncbi:hypothetical protein Y032_0690g1562 [Ancylostoma ceylanicum]|uniref:G-protein coupled receptors family 1 profile domain-containing protein n=2 Tax=Ancylostoma ceylanicum TaxID=53326 RepID=A0A016WGW0_9BILA|nr:hypothetical protein Y032_0690g1562 [Ancylostoma ceylanicum]
MIQNASNVLRAGVSGSCDKIVAVTAVRHLVFVFELLADCESPRHADSDGTHKMAQTAFESVFGERFCGFPVDNHVYVYHYYYMKASTISDDPRDMVKHIQEDPNSLLHPLYVYIVEGAIAAALNVPLTIAMLATPKLRTRREFQVITGLAATDAVFGLAFVISGVSRIHVMRQYCSTAMCEIPLTPRWKCSTLLYVQLITIAFQLQGVLLLAVAVDRLLAVITPIKYLQFNVKYTFVLAAGPYTLVAVATVTNVLIVQNDRTLVSPFCFISFAVYPGFHDYIILLRIFCVISSASIYIVIVAHLNKHLSRVSAWSREQRSLRRSTFTVGLTTVNAVVFLLVPDVIVYFDILDWSQSYSAVLYSLSMANVILNALILVFRHREIIHSFKRFVFVILFRRSPKAKNTVMVLSTNYSLDMNDEDPRTIVKLLFLYIAEGAIAAALNIPLMVATLTNNSLRTRREYQVIIGICFVDAVFGIAFVLTAINRLEIIQENFYTGIPQVPRCVCSTRYYVHLLTIAYQLQGVLTITVATDRFLAVMTPIRYLKFGTQYTVTILAGPYLYVAICTVINAVITLQDDTPVSSFCLTVTAVSPTFYYYMLLLRISCVFISALIYVVIIAHLYKHFARIEKMQASSRESSQFRSIRRSTITIGLSTVNAVLFLLLPDVIKYIGVFDYSRSNVTTLYSLSMTNVVLNAFIFAYRHKEIMENFKHLMCTLLRRRKPDDPQTSNDAGKVLPNRKAFD